MHREDASRYLLYIEPDKSFKSEHSVDDDITDIMEFALFESITGSSGYSNLECAGKFTPRNGYRGVHHTDCGVRSSNTDYLLKNGMITNSLCVYYLRHYRDVIPRSEMDKVDKLVRFYEDGKKKISIFSFYGGLPR